MTLRVLMVLPYAPDAVRVRPRELLRGLRAAGHEVTLAAPWADERDRATLAALERDGVAVLTAPSTRGGALRHAAGAALRGRPLQWAWCWSAALADQAARHARGGACDVVHVEHLRAARFGEHMLATLRRDACAARPAVVWDGVDCIARLMRMAQRHAPSRAARVVARLEAGRTAKCEARLLRTFDAAVVTSEADAAALHALAPGAARPGVVPNGVGTAFFTPGAGGEHDHCNAAAPRPGPGDVVLTGQMSYPANAAGPAWLVGEVMPRGWARRPETRAFIVGQAPPAAVRRLGRDGRVVVTGRVDDLRPYLRGAGVAACPLVYGVGVQNKALEAMACGAAVVTTPTAVAALACEPGRDLLVAADADAFAAHVLTLLDDPARRAALGDAGRAYVLRHHQWSDAVAAITAVYHRAIAGVRATPTPLATASPPPPPPPPPPR